MKKSLVALAALAVAGVASAQSSVTLFGVVDASISHYSAKADYYNNQPLYVVGANGQLAVNPAFLQFGNSELFGRRQSVTRLANSGYNSSRLGFRGTEDLGGGLAASFWLEAPISNDDGVTGVSTFGRRSTVSLSGGFGEIRLGRDYVPTFWNDTVFDPFGTNGVGTNLISRVGQNLSISRAGLSGGAFNGALSGGTDNEVRASNAVGYFLPPNLGGFYGQVMYAIPENIKNSSGFATAANACPGVTSGVGAFVDCQQSKRTQYIGGRFGYANGPLDVAVAYAQSTVSDVDGTGRLGLASFGTNSDRKLNTLNLGASYDFGAVKLFGELSQKRDKQEGSSYAYTANTVANFGSFTSAHYTDKYNGALLGFTVPVGPGLIRAAYSRVKFDNGFVPAVTVANLFTTNSARDTTANQLALGYVHNLSKRTALYATVAHLRIKDGQYNTIPATTVGGGVGFPTTTATALTGYAPRSSTGYDFGIRHAF